VSYELANPARIDEILAVVGRYMDAFIRMDPDGMIDELSTEQISISYPYHESGDTAVGAYRSHSGPEHVASYLRGEGEHVGFARYIKLRFLDMVYRPVADGSAVYLETRGDHTMADQTSYKNYYVFRFDFAGDKIINIAQYHNPMASLVPYGRA
jgi:hypothetical protein